MNIIYYVDAQRLEQDREAYRRYVAQQYTLFVAIPLFSVSMAVFIWYLLTILGIVQ